MSQTHSIQKLVIELHIDEQETAWELQNEVSADYQGLIVREMEQVFDALIGPDEMIIIDRLEINVGEMDQVSQLPELIRGRAREALEKLIYEARSSEDGSGEINFVGEEGEIIRTQVHLVNRVTDDAARFEYFLNYGLLPASGVKESVRDIVDRLLEKSPEQLREILFRRTSFKRMILQLRAEQLVRLLELKTADAAIILAKKEELDPAFPVLNEKKTWQQVFEYAGPAESFLDFVVSMLSENERSSFRPELASEDIIAAVKKSAESKTPSTEPGRAGEEHAALLPEKLRQPASGNLLSPAYVDELLSGLDETAALFLKNAQEENIRVFMNRAIKAVQLALAGLTLVEPGHLAAALLPLIRTLKDIIAGLQKANRSEEAAVFEKYAEKIRQVYNENLKKSTVQDDDTAPIDEGIYINNAGLVIIASYLPVYFGNLEMTEENEFIDPGMQERAVHLLQYMAAGNDEETEEQHLVLNKIICGIPWIEPVSAGIEITEEETEETEEMLHAFLRNWEKMKTTSVNGLRANFLAREGRLEKREKGWMLTVEKATHDFLLDSLPVSFEKIQLPWMPEPVWVEW
ncbi:MAG: hypothetical protein FD123_2571 [Bacteroidetes bacterium]|nr:MAG: hypothetical protein FD123_2571 [Bacteroidota bacterium]